MNSKTLRNYISLIIENTEITMADDFDNEDQVTFGDFKSFLGKKKKAGTTKTVLKFFVNVGLGSAIAGLVDGLNLATAGNIESVTSEVLETTVAEKLKKYSPDEILKSLYGINSAKGIKHFSIPDEVSIVVDDKVEDKFLKYLLEQIIKEPDNKVVKENYTLEEWNKWLGKNYNALAIKK